MKFLMKTCWTIAIVITWTVSAMGQSVGDYRSATTGDWNSAPTWQRFNGSVWGAAPSAPTGSEFITVQSADSVNVNVAVSITGILSNQGKLGNGENLTIANGGIFQHDQEAGSLPLATWSEGSLLLITGTIAVTPENRNQSFYHVMFNTPGLLSNLNMGWNGNTIGGDIMVVNTGSARWYMTAPPVGDSAFITIMGDIIVTGGQYSSNGSSNANTKIEIHHYGSVIVTGGNLSVSRGSQGSGTGSTRWYLHEGDFVMSNATTQNSNQTNAWFVFDKAGTQFLMLGEGNTLSSFPIEVKSGTTLALGESKVRGSGLFRLNAGATLETGADGGLDSAVSGTGALTFSAEANYTFNGLVAQATGLQMPDTVNNLVIENAAGVTLSQETTINGVLRLKAGVFDNTIPFTLGASGSISYEGGSLLVTSVDQDGPTIPKTFFVGQNYPNPFNPSTAITYGVPSGGFVSVKVYSLLGQEVATLFEGIQEAGVHTLRFEAGNLTSGVYVCRVQAGSASATRQMVLMK